MAALLKSVCTLNLLSVCVDSQDFGCRDVSDCHFVDHFSLVVEVKFVSNIHSHWRMNLQ